MILAKKIVSSTLNEFLRRSAKFGPIFTAKTTTRGKGTVVIVPRRAMLYVPGHDKRKIDKISSTNVDCAVLDLEDGVALNKKEEARTFVSEIPEDYNFGKSDHAIRINSVESGLAEEDLKAVFSCRKIPATLMIPKVDNIEHVQWIHDKMLHFSKTRHLDKKFRIVVFVESARSLMDLRQICSKFIELSNEGPYQLDGLVFGSDDFCADIGATRTAQAFELLTARQMMVMIGKIFKLQVIDMVYIDYKDTDGLTKQSKEGAGMGFTGKQVIHPTQVPIVQEAFSPSKEKIEWASELIRLFEDHQKHGKGAFTFRGAMIDMPLLRQAQYVMELSRLSK